MPEVIGTMVNVTTQGDWHRLVDMPASLKGEFDPKVQEGFVLFPTQAAARAAWRELRDGPSTK